MGELSGLHHASLTVSDRDASADWYVRVLGFRELFREESEDRRASVMTFATGGYSVGLVEHRPHRDDGFAPVRIGLDHLAFSVATREELIAWQPRLEQHGVAHSGVIDIPPGAILNFKDPDGIALALFWDS